MMTDGLEASRWPAKGCDALLHSATSTGISVMMLCDELVYDIFAVTASTQSAKSALIVLEVDGSAVRCCESVVNIGRG